MRAIIRSGVQNSPILESGLFSPSLTMNHLLVNFKHDDEFRLLLELLFGQAIALMSGQARINSEKDEEHTARHKPRFLFGS